MLRRSLKYLRLGAIHLLCKTDRGRGRDKSNSYFFWHGGERGWVRQNITFFSFSYRLFIYLVSQIWPLYRQLPPTPLWANVSFWWNPTPSLYITRYKNELSVTNTQYFLQPRLLPRLDCNRQFCLSVFVFTPVAQLTDKMDASKLLSWVPWWCM